MERHGEGAEIVVMCKPKTEMYLAVWPLTYSNFSTRTGKKFFCYCLSNSHLLSINKKRRLKEATYHFKEVVHTPNFWAATWRGSEKYSSIFASVITTGLCCRICPSISLALRTILWLRIVPASGVSLQKMFRDFIANVCERCNKMQTLARVETWKSFLFAIIFSQVSELKLEILPFRSIILYWKLG